MVTSEATRNKDLCSLSLRHVLAFLFRRSVDDRAHRLVATGPHPAFHVGQRHESTFRPMIPSHYRSANLTSPPGPHSADVASKEEHLYADASYVTSSLTERL